VGMVGCCMGWGVASGNGWLLHGVRYVVGMVSCCMAWGVASGNGWLLHGVGASPGNGWLLHGVGSERRGMVGYCITLGRSIRAEVVGFIGGFIAECFAPTMRENVGCCREWVRGNG
jgi:hypothetical protein